MWNLWVVPWNIHQYMRKHSKRADLIFFGAYELFWHCLIMFFTSYKNSNWVWILGLKRLMLKYVARSENSPLGLGLELLLWLEKHKALLMWNYGIKGSRVTDLGSEVSAAYYCHIHWLERGGRKKDLIPFYFTFHLLAISLAALIGFVSFVFWI